MEYLKLLIKGTLIGIAGILPGVSGGTLAVTMGIYERLIEIVGKFYVNFKENIKFLLPIGIGSGIGVILISKVIDSVIEKYEVFITLLFLGLLIGGIPRLLKKVDKKSFKSKNIIIFVISFLISMSFIFIQGTGTDVTFTNMNFMSYIVLFIIGFISAATLVIPGISGSLILMIIGYYKPLVNTISSLLHFDNLVNNILILLPFGIGILLGLVLISKLITKALKKYSNQTYYAIYGVILASIIGVLLPLELGIGIMLLFLGIYIAYRMEKIWEQ